MAGIEKSRTSIYHPVGNGMTEWFSITLLRMHGTLEPEKNHWHKYVAPLVHVYNCTHHSSTVYLDGNHICQSTWSLAWTGAQNPKTKHYT